MAAPVAIGLLLCDQAIYEEGTRNATLVNTFSTITVDGFPSLPISFTIFAMLTDGVGDVTISLTITHLESDEIVFQRAEQARFRDPFVEVRLRCRVQNFVVPAAGTYVVMILADGQWVAQRRLEVLEGEVDDE
jgi:hypothetical protein